MRFLAVILMICCLGSQSLLRLGIVAWYETNKDYVTERFCVNKDKPEMQCHGKCYLCRQLKKTEDKSEPGKQAPSKQNNLVVVSSLPEEKLMVPLLFYKDQQEHHDIYNRHHHSSPLSRLLRPPQGLSGIAA